MKDLVIAHADLVVPLAGLMLGAVFGAVVVATNFCTMGAVSDIALLGDWRRLRAWALAAGVAMIGTQLAVAGGVADLAGTMYLTPRLDWLGHLTGGMLFGIGMVLAGGCASRALVRIGTGDARALVVVAAMGLAAGASVDGVLEPARVALAAMSAIDLSAWGWRGQSLAEIASGLTGRLAPTTTGLAAGIALTVVSLASRPLWRSPRNVVAGLVIGLAVAGGFLVTGLAADEWARAPRPPVSLTFVRPAADVIDAVTVWAVPGHRAFAVASVVGVVVGAFLAGWAKGRLHWQGFVGWRDAALSLAGGLLMGIGGIAALGCTIGQGVTGLATLSLGAMIAVSGMIAGGFAGLRLLEQFRL